MPLSPEPELIFHVHHVSHFSYQGSRARFLVDRHPPREIATLLSHSDETLDTRSTGRTNQLTRVNVDRRWYGSAMKIPAMTHGTLDQGGSICGPEKKLQDFATVQTRATSPNFTGRRRAGGTCLRCLGGRLGQAGIWNITQAWVT
jgi:hypothetical protein